MVENNTGTTADGDLSSELNFLFEVGYLKDLRRSGWLLAGVNDGESVAEHVFRTAIVGFVLACLEGADPYRVATLCLFHDVQETRVSDLNPLTKKYFDQKQAEDVAVKEICDALDARISSPLKKIFEQYSDKDTPEAAIARDADLLECILQAYAYKEKGFQGADNFVSGPAKLQSQLTSNAAIRLAELAATRSSSEWWKLLTQA